MPLRTPQQLTVDQSISSLQRLLMQSVVWPVSQQGNSPPVETRITRDCAALATHWAASACCCVACVPLKIIDVVKSPLWDVLSCSDKQFSQPACRAPVWFPAATQGPALRTHCNVTCPGSGRQAGSPAAASHPCRQLATSSCWWKQSVQGAAFHYS